MAAEAAFAAENPAQSATTTMTITVTPVNDAPVAVPETAITTAATPVTINVLANDTDVDNAPPAAANAGLTVVNAAVVVGGTVQVNANNTVTFTPAAGFAGTGSFTYQARDPSGALSNLATVTVTVNAVAVDLDIAQLRVAANARVGANIAISLSVRNNSAVPAAQAGRQATIVGVQNGIRVYSQTLTVTDSEVRRNRKAHADPTALSLSPSLCIHFRVYTL